LARAVTIVASGGMPVTNIDTAGALGVPLTPVSSGGVPITLVDSGGMPAVLVNETGSLFYGLGGIQPLHYWDFTTNRALFNGADVGAVASTPGWSLVRTTVGTAEDLTGNIIEFASGELRRTDKGVLIEETRINLFLNSAVGVTQSITVAAVAHTLSFRGTGTITLTGTSTAGPLVGTGVNNRVTLTFTPTAGSLTLTVTGSCTNVQLEAGSSASSWIPTTGVSVQRNADAVSVTSPGVAYPLSVYVRFNRTIETYATNTAAINLDNGTATERYTLFVNATTNLVQPIVTAGAVNQLIVNTSPALTANTTTKFAVRASTASANYARDGVAGTATGAITVPATPNRLIFGANPSFGLQLNGYIQAVAIFNTALTDAQLQAITS